MENIENKLEEGEASRHILIVQHKDTGTRIEVKTYTHGGNLQQTVSLDQRNELSSEAATIKSIMLCKELKEQFELTKDEPK